MSSKHSREGSAEEVREGEEDRERECEGEGVGEGEREIFFAKVVCKSNIQRM